MANGFFSGFIRGSAVGCLCLGAASIYIDVTQMPTTPKEPGTTAQAPSAQQTVPKPGGAMEQDAPVIAAPTTDSTIEQPAAEMPVQTTQIDTPTVTPEPVIPDNEPEPAPQIVEPSENQSVVVTSVPPDVPSEPNVPEAPKMATALETVMLPTEQAAPAQNIPSDPDTEQMGTQEVVMVFPKTEPQDTPRVVPQDPVIPTPQPKSKPALPTIAPVPETPDALPEEPNQTEAPDLGELALEAFTDIETIGTAIELYAAQAVPPDERPMLALVLTATSNITVQSVSDLGFPVTIALDPSGENTAGLMENLRLAGHEMAIIGDVSAATTAQDIDASLARDIARLPKTVAVIERQKGALQGNVNSIKAVPDTLAQSGHGLLTYSSGLNTIARIATDAGVHNAQIPRNIPVRDLGNVRQIERALENAMLDATRNGSEGTVIVVPATTAVLEFIVQWSQYERTQRVQFVPLSQYLKLMSQ